MNQSSHHCQGNRKRHQEPLEDVCTFQLQEHFNGGSTQEPDARTRPPSLRSGLEQPGGNLTSVVLMKGRLEGEV